MTTDELFSEGFWDILARRYKLRPATIRTLRSTVAGSCMKDTARAAGVSYQTVQMQRVRACKALNVDGVEALIAELTKLALQHQRELGNDSTI
jgi:DNA-binding CsgD family transcriptional regulator